MPSPSTVVKWAGGYVKNAPPGFSERYNQARLIQADVRFEKLVDTANAAGVDLVSINRTKLIIDTEKWSLSKQYRAKYGDRTTLEHDTPKDSPFAVKSEVRSVVDVLSDDARELIRKEVYAHLQSVQVEEDVSERGRITRRKT